MNQFYQESDYERVLDTVKFDSHPIEESELPFRTQFWRDYARILHSPAFRRLKGKTQLFPGFDSDFFRCRLTHSLEVAEVGKSIANYVNYKLKKLYEKQECEYDQNSFINTDLIQLACLAHDIGHPPFGHQGEEALDIKMKSHGGFEGNAQTLRILAILEKKEYADPPEDEKDSLDYTGFDKNGNDLRKGLNLCFRSLASILKYDHIINYSRSESEPIEKGYYRIESELVEQIKQNVAPGYTGDDFKTIECQIMDIADDIAYSVYDIEDSFKGGFTDPLGYLTAIESKEAINNVAKKVNETGKKYSKQLMINCTAEDVVDIIYRLLLDLDEPMDGTPSTVHIPLLSKLYARVGYLRTKLSTDLVTKFIYSVEIDFNPSYPALSKVYLEEQIELEIEVLKRLTYEFQITSPKLKIVEHRGKAIVSKLFDILSKEEGWDFLPRDVKNIVIKLKNANKGDQIPRIICDFISGMTDKFAVEYFDRLISSNSISIHRPIN